MPGRRLNRVKIIFAAAIDAIADPVAVQIELQLHVARPVIQIDGPLIASGFGKFEHGAALLFIFRPAAGTCLLEAAMFEKHLPDVAAIGHSAWCRRWCPHAALVAIRAGYRIEIPLRSAVVAEPDPVAMDVNLQLHVARGVVEIDRPVIATGFPEREFYAAIGIIFGPVTPTGFAKQAAVEADLPDIIAVHSLLLPLRLRRVGNGQGQRSRHGNGQAHRHRSVQKCHDFPNFSGATLGEACTKRVLLTTLSPIDKIPPEMVRRVFVLPRRGGPQAASILSIACDSASSPLIIC